MIATSAGDAPIVGLGERFRRLTGWRRHLMAIVAGAVASISLPPADALPLLWVALPVFFWLLEGVDRRRSAFWLGWSFGFGYLAFSLYWLTFALFVALDQYWWLIPFGSNGLAFGLAIFWAGAGYLTAPRAA